MISVSNYRSCGNGCVLVLNTNGVYFNTNIRLQMSILLHVELTKLLLREIC